MVATENWRWLFFLTKSFLIIGFECFPLLFNFPFLWSISFSIVFNFFILIEIEGRYNIFVKGVINVLNRKWFTISNETPKVGIYITIDNLLSNYSQRYISTKSIYGAFFEKSKWLCVILRHNCCKLSSLSNIRNSLVYGVEGQSTICF